MFWPKVLHAPRIWACIKKKSQGFFVGVIAVAFKF